MVADAMKAIIPSAVALLLLAACVPMGTGMPGPPTPGLPGPGNEQAKDEAFRQGFGFGQRDARLGRQANYMTYNNYYNSSTKKDFANGYMSGYRRGSRP